MELVITHEATTHTAMLSGQLTYADTKQFKTLLELVTEKTITELDIDFTHLSFIDSAGMGMLLLLRDECQNRNIRISLRGAYGQVERIFTISKFDQLFSMKAQ